MVLVIVLDELQLSTVYVEGDEKFTCIDTGGIKRTL